MNKELPTRVQLVVGLALLALGGFPWLYTPLFFGRMPPATDEGSGMLGTLLFLFAGLPGLSVTLRAWKALKASRASRKQSVRYAPGGEEDTTR